MRLAPAAVECGSRPLDDDFEALSTHRRPEVGSHLHAIGSMLTVSPHGQRRWRRRNSKVPFPLMVWGPSKNSISARSGIFIRVA